MKNIDIVVQFALLWGIKIGNTSTRKEQNLAEEMKMYDSQELSSIFTAWSEEYLKGNFTDTVDFFEEKLKGLIN